MTVLYWYKTGANAQWNTLAGNWWLDQNHTQQAPSLPAAGDEVYLTGQTAPTTGPSSVSLLRFDTALLACDMTNPAITSPITIQPNGFLRMGPSTGTGRRHTWGGNATQTGIAITFRSYSTNAGVLGDYAVFTDFSANTGMVGQYATFNWFAANNGGSIGDNATFNDSSALACGSIGASGGILNWNSCGYLFDAALGLDLQIVSQQVRVRDDLRIKFPSYGNTATLIVDETSSVVMLKREGRLLLEIDQVGTLPVLLHQTTLPLRFNAIYTNPRGVCLR